MPPSKSTRARTIGLVPSASAFASCAGRHGGMDGARGECVCLCVCVCAHAVRRAEVSKGRPAGEQRDTQEAQRRPRRAIPTSEWRVWAHARAMRW
eukprot:3990163-Prymnesium_polylepis.1